MKDQIQDDGETISLTIEPSYGFVVFTVLLAAFFAYLGIPTREGSRGPVLLCIGGFFLLGACRAFDRRIYLRRKAR